MLWLERRRADQIPWRARMQRRRIGARQRVPLCAREPGYEGSGEDDHFGGETVIACRGLEIRPVGAKLILRLLAQLLYGESKPAIGLLAARQAGGDKSEAGNIGEVVIAAAL